MAGGRSALTVMRAGIHGGFPKAHARTPCTKETHIILDNLSAYKTKTVAEFLDRNRRVRFNSTPTYSSWPNQVEIWFARIQRDVIDRGVFTSVADLS
jgi:hypothetical protein